MASGEELPAKFIKTLVAKSCKTNKMSIPEKFCERYEKRIPKRVQLVLRDGEEIDVKFKRSKRLFVGMRQFFRHIDCRNGVNVIFQYNGGNNFWVYVINQRTRTEVFAEVFEDLGCKFCSVFLAPSAYWKNIHVPSEFVAKFGESIPGNVVFRLTNGATFEGFYNKDDNTLSGLQQVYKLILLSHFEMLVFTYCGDGLFDVTAFNIKCIEKDVIDDNFDGVLEYEKFAIELKRSHLQEYCLGVTIWKKFKSLTDKWRSYEKITVSHLDWSWELIVKKRDNKTEVHGGWTKFWNDLQSKIDDVCVFKTKQSRNDFLVEIYRHGL